MAENSTGLQVVVVHMAPDSNFTFNKSYIKIGSEEGPIIECSVLTSINLPILDKGQNIDMVQGSARAMECLHSVDLTELSDGSGYLCTCGRHLVHVSSVPVTVCQILTLPDGVSISH